MSFASTSSILLWAASLLVCAGLLTTLLVYMRGNIHNRAMAVMSRYGRPTGLADRNTFEAACSQHPFERHIHVLVLCDVEHLPLQAEHQLRVLHRLGRVLQEGVREGDHVAHLEGATFALALRQMDLAAARELVQRIAAQVHRQPWDVPQDAVKGPVTVNFGLTRVREGDTLVMAMHRADVLLYQDKDVGAGRIVVEEPLAERM